MRWKKDVFVVLISLSFFAWPVQSVVTETTQSYTCTEELHQVESEYAMQNPDCDQYWSEQEHSVATFLRLTPECHSPCKELFLGRIVLNECVNITLAVICSRDDLTEHRVHFYGKMVPKPLGIPVERGHFGIFLSVSLLSIAIVCLLGVGCPNRNNRNKPSTGILDEDSLQ